MKRYSGLSYAFVALALSSCTAAHSVPFASPNAAIPHPSNSGSQPTATAIGAYLIVPSKSAAKSLRSSRLHAAYVSPSTESVFVNVNGENVAQVDVLPGSSDCTPVTGGQKCYISFDAPIGSDSIAVQVWDKPPQYVDYGIGTLLAENTSTYSITASTTEINISLHAIVKYITLSLQDDYIAQSDSALSTPETDGVFVTAFDPDDNTIDSGTYDSPITLSDRDTSGITTLSPTTITGVPSSSSVPDAVLSYHGGYIDATAIDATTPSITQSTSIFPVGLIFDSRGGTGKLDAVSHASPSTQRLTSWFGHEPNAKANSKMRRFDSDGPYTWDGNVFSGCTINIGENCSMVPMALGQTITTPLTFDSGSDQQSWYTDISGGELTVTYAPSVTSPGQQTCITFYAPPTMGQKSDVFDINEVAPGAQGGTPILSSGFSALAPLNIAPADYFKRYDDC